MQYVLLSLRTPRWWKTHSLRRAEGDQGIKCGVKSDSWCLWFLVILCMERNSLMSTGENQVGNFIFDTKVMMELLTS